MLIPLVLMAWGHLSVSVLVFSVQQRAAGLNMPMNSLTNQHRGPPLGTYQTAGHLEHGLRGHYVLWVVIQGPLKAPPQHGEHQEPGRHEHPRWRDDRGGSRTKDTEGGLCWVATRSWSLARLRVLMGGGSPGSKQEKGRKQLAPATSQRMTGRERKGPVGGWQVRRLTCTCPGECQNQHRWGWRVRGLRTASSTCSLWEAGT